MSEFFRTQTGFEQAALRLLAREDVRAAVASEAERWREGTPGFLPETYAQLPASIDEVALLVALQVVNGDPRRPQVVEISVGPHTWGGLDVPGGRWGINNPDTLYFAVPIEPESRYVLRGRPLGTPPTDINITVQTPDVWGTLASIGHRDLAFESDGTFTVEVGRGRWPGPLCPEPVEGLPEPVEGPGPLSPEPVEGLPEPAEGPGPLFPELVEGPGPLLPELVEGPRGTVLLIRQTLADWTAELPYELTVERLSGPDPAPELSEDDLARRLIARLGVVIDHSLTGLQPPIFALPVNTIRPPGSPGDKPGYLVAQRNTLGHFRLDDDEALVVVLSPGGAGYASLVATNVWGISGDPTQRQTGLNNHQAVADADGRITIVVSNADPGIANWIDLGGKREGIVMLRWQLLADGPTADGDPDVELGLVRTRDLPGVLPPAISSGRPRAENARNASYSRRFTSR